MDYPTSIANWDVQRALAAARPSRPALPGDARRHLVQILLQVLDLRATLLDGDPHEIADRQHGQETVATDDGQVANVGLIHLVHRGLIILVRVRNNELRGHHLLQPRTSGFEPPVDYSTRDVALGEHPTEPLAVHDRYDPDIVGGHHPAGVGDGRVALEHEEEAVAHDVPERLHGAPPKKSRSLATSANEGDRTIERAGAAGDEGQLVRDRYNLSADSERGR